MRIDHVHFYVKDAQASRDWFVQHLGFEFVARGARNLHTCTEVVRNGAVYFVLSSPRTAQSRVADFLTQHPPGVADIAFGVDDVEALMHRARAQGAKVLQPLQHYNSGKQRIKYGKIAAWGTLNHTLIERRYETPTQSANESEQEPPDSGFIFSGIDHVVLNVAAGDLDRAVDWYQSTLGFQTKQAFKIQTDRSGLHSQVLMSSDHQVQLPINQPASANSQIQEFLDVNRGPGIQHIALRTDNIVPNVAQLRAWGLAFLPVPPSYYSQLQQRPGLPLSALELAEIAQQEILVDWQNSDSRALLLQIFTQPIFGEPTFFFEIIERRLQAPGFGEGNFRALFEAIEREQIKRGVLPDDD